MLVEIQFVQLLAQVGAVGILGYIVVWLTRTKIPDDRKERAEERAAAQAERQVQVEQREVIQEAYTAMAQQQRTDYLASLREINESHAADNEECRKERRDLAKAAQAEREADRLARHELANVIQGVLAELHTRDLPDRSRSPYDDERKG